MLFCREDRIRTCDPLVPNQVRYRPALLPELTLPGVSSEPRLLPEFNFLFPNLVIRISATLPTLVGMRIIPALLPELTLLGVSSEPRLLPEFNFLFPNRMIRISATLPTLVGMRIIPALLPELNFLF